MNRDTTIRLLFIAVLVFGLLACLCACAVVPEPYPAGMSMDDWLRARGYAFERGVIDPIPTEFYKP